MAQAEETTSTCVEFVEEVSLGDIETRNWEEGEVAPHFGLVTCFLFLLGHSEGAL